jgi:plasmid maintenance system antidote protein VapI
MSDAAAKIKGALVDAVTQRMQEGGMTISELAQRTHTQRQAIRRILDRNNTSITLKTLIRTTDALGLKLTIAVEPAPVAELAKLARQLPGAKGRKAARLKAAFVRRFYGRTAG